MYTWVICAPNALIVYLPVYSAMGCNVTTDQLISIVIVMLLIMLNEENCLPGITLVFYDYDSLIRPLFYGLTHTRLHIHKYRNVKQCNG